MGRSIDTLWNILYNYIKKASAPKPDKYAKDEFNAKLMNHTKQLTNQMLNDPIETNGVMFIKTLVKHSMFETILKFINTIPPHSTSQMFWTNEAIFKIWGEKEKKGWNIIDGLISAKQWNLLNRYISRHSGGANFTTISVRDNWAKETMLMQIIAARKFKTAYLMIASKKDVMIDSTEIFHNKTILQTCFIQACTLMRDYAVDLIKVISIIIDTYPHIMKSIGPNDEWCLMSLVQPYMKPLRDKIYKNYSKHKIIPCLYKNKRDGNVGNSHNVFIETMIFSNDEEYVMKMLNTFPPPTDMLWKIYSGNGRDKSLYHTPLMIAIMYGMSKVANYIKNTYCDKYQNCLIFTNKEKDNAKIYAIKYNMTCISKWIACNDQIFCQR